jgi:hypothetical protein
VVPYTIDSGRDDGASRRRGAPRDDGASRGRGAEASRTIQPPWPDSKEDRRHRRKCTARGPEFPLRRKEELPPPAATPARCSLPSLPRRRTPNPRDRRSLGRPPAAGKLSTSSRRSSTRARTGGHPVLRPAPLGTRPTTGSSKPPRLSTFHATSASQRREQQRHPDLIERSGPRGRRRQVDGGNL